MLIWSSRKRARTSPAQKKSIPPEILLAQEEEIQQLISRFESEELHGNAVARLEVLVRPAVFKSANALVGWLLQQAADRIDARYQPEARPTRKGRETIGVQGIFGSFQLQRDYYYHEGKNAVQIVDFFHGLEHAALPA